MSKKLFNKSWLFCEFPLDSSFESMVNSKDFYPVNVPHDWMIYHVKDLYRDSYGFYKKTFSLSYCDTHSYILRFEGIYMDSAIYCNGQFVMEWKYGYSTFEADITPFVKNGENSVYVVCTYRSPNTRWYSGAGIYRNVWFIEKEQSHFISDGIYISTKKESGGFSLTIDSEQFVSSTDKAFISHSVFDAEGNVLLSDSVPVSVFGQTSKVTHKIFVSDPNLWDINNPYLYKLKSSLILDGNEVDSEITSFGFRTISFDPDKGFFLNGRNVKINGVCEHHDLGALGAAMNRHALKRKFEKLIKMGVNSIRTSHNMPAVELMELADEMGILIFSESFDMWELPKTKYDYSNFFPTWYEKDVASWVRRDRNHPSLFAWSIGNEIYDTHAGNGIKWTTLLRDEVRKHDYYHNAYIGIGSNYIEWDNAQACSDLLELSGYNYAERLYNEHHKKYPNWIIFGSETSSTVQSRGIYHFPYETRILTYQDGQCSSLGNCSTNWGAKNAATVISDHRDRDFVFGQYLWSGFDYIGEPTPFHSKNSFFGQLDTAGFEKDTYFQYQAEWTDVKDNPMVHLLPYWDFNDGQIIDVCAYSNAPFVELFLNGTSMGRQFIDHINGRELQGHWKVPYTKGELLVKAYDESGNVIASDSAYSFADPVKICTKASKDNLISDGSDLIFIEIYTCDSDGHFVANARNRMHIEVTGAGRLVGLDNGDSTDYDEYKGTSKKLFSGKLLAIIAATDHEGEIHVDISSPGLISKSLCLYAENSTYPLESEVFSECLQITYNDEVPVRKIEFSYNGSLSLSKELPSIAVPFSIYPYNTTYFDIEFVALTKDAVPANFVKLTPTDHEVKVDALGDGSFTLTGFAYNGKDIPEVVSTLDFEISGVGKASYDAYSLIPGIQFSNAHSADAKLSFLGGVFLPPSDDGKAYVTYSDIDFGAFGSNEIHVPLFSFENEVPVEIYLGEPLNGECLFKGVYKAQSIYNTYQENVFSLSKRLSGVQNISLVFFTHGRFSLQGIYFTKSNKAYSTLFAMEHTRITGDSYTLGASDITSIGNNVCIEFDNMNFNDGLSCIRIAGRSRNPVTSLHILFTEGDICIKQMVEIPGSDEYKEHVLSLSDVRTNGKVSFMFLPGSDFDFKEFEFTKA